MATKGTREKIKLESTAGTGHFYTTSKNKKTMPEKMLIKKFDPKARKHVEYKVSGSGSGSAQLVREIAQGRNATAFCPLAPGLQFTGELLAGV